MKITKDMLPSGNLLKGSEIEEVLDVKITDAKPITFGQGTEEERTTVSLYVTAEGWDEPKSFALGARQVKSLLEKLGDDTDKWIGRSLTLTPIPSKMPNGTPTTGINVTVRAKK